jgi:threonine/homoserine/homoserine lactone efflux protein
MPDWNMLLVFVLAAVTVSLVPGPDMLFVAANAMGGGARVGVLSALGISVAMSVHTTAAALGLSFLFVRSAWAFEVVRYAGAAYLLWLGIRALRSPGGGASAWGTEAAAAVTVLRRGFLTNLLNPKVIVFFAAFLPQFVVPQSGPVILQFLLLGALFTAVGFLVDAGVAVVGGRARTLLARRPGVPRALERISGFVFVGLGIRLLLERPSS